MAYPETQMIIDTSDTPFCFVVVEHWAALTPGEPPECVYLFTAPFKDAFTTSVALGNTKWSELFNKPGGCEILVRIIARTKTQRDANHICVNRLREMPKRPICNAQGMTLAGRARQIVAEDGRWWRTQMEAAEALGVSQSTIAAHLSGRQASVRGLRLTYGAML